jgi:hypothetical protein
MFLTNILNPISNSRLLALGAIVVVISACSQTSSEMDTRRDYSETVVSDNHVPREDGVRGLRSSIGDVQAHDWPCGWASSRACVDESAVRLGRQQRTASPFLASFTV